ncbi:MAG: DUF4347 domain-containing protein [Gammaproteobacteria bacterium]
MANRSSIKNVPSRFDADDSHFELEPLEPRLLLSADPLGTQVSADLSTFQSDRDTGDEAYDAEQVTAFLSALHQPEQDLNDTGSLLPAALDLDSFDALSAGDNGGVLDDFSVTIESLLKRDPADSEPARQEIIFVDSHTPDYELLLADIQQADSGVRYDIIILDANTDGIDQISDILDAYHNLDAVHVIGHGNTDVVQLGDTWLRSTNIEQYASSIAGWQDNLSSEADLLFYGCNLAGSETGKELVEQLSRLTGADVAASEDLTGGISVGGDWELEHQIGDIEARIVVGEAAQQQWQGVLVDYVSQTSSNTSSVFDSANAFGQSFAHDSGGGTYDVDYISIELDRDGAASGTITVSLRDGWNGTVLASATKDASTLNENPTLENFNFAPVSLNDFQTYTIQVEVGPSSGTLNYGWNFTNPYFFGDRHHNGFPDIFSDLAFEVGSSGAPVFQNAGPFNVDEGATTGTVVGNVDADDGDGGAVDAGITYSITTNVNPDADGENAFAIDASTGEITVKDAGDIDYELDTSLTITVQADDGLYTTSTDITIDVNDITPSISVGGAATVAASDTFSLEIKTIDPGTNDIISYTINWGDGTVTTEAYTGSTTTVSHVYNTAGYTHSITVAATDTGGTTWTASDLLVGNWVAGGDDIFRFDGESGNLDGTFDATGGVLNRPYAPVVGPDGNFYVSGHNSDNIVKFAADGSYLGVFSANALLNKPTDMAWGSDGNLYVSNDGDDNILRFSADGSSVIVWGISGGLLDGPTGLAFGPDGDLYVASYNDDSVVKFDGASGGTPILVIGSGLNKPEQIVFDAAGNLYIANGSDDEVAKWDGTVLTSYFTHPDLSFATGLAFGPDGQLYVSSLDNEKVLRYDGITGEVFADDGPGGLEKPVYLAFTPDHQVTVTGNQAPTISIPPEVFINELHYDNIGVDVGEAVEVMAPAGTDLTGWSLVFYSGADGLAYHTEALAGIIPNQADNFGTLAFAIAPIQNSGTGADGIALVNVSADVVQFISYEGTLTAGDGPAAGLTSTNIGVAEDGATLVGDSLQLTGTGSEMTWMAASANTFGALNTGQNVFARDTGIEDTDQLYNHAEMLTLLGANDPDDADAALTVSISNVVNGTLALTGGSGGLGTTFTFTPDLHFNGQLTFDYQVLDDDLAASAIGNGIITIAPVNDNPTGLGSLTTTSVDDNAVALNLFSALSVSDVDVGENDLVLRITLSDPTAGTITGGGFIDQGGGVYTASALTVAQANTALDNVQFKPVDNSGSTGSFTTDISVDVDDQGGAGYQSVLSATTVTINRVNDAPTATNLSSTSSYNEGDASVPITDIVVSDVDAGETITATLTLANTATGSLSANDGASYTAATGVWTITDTVANVNTALANLTFTPVADNEVDTSIAVAIDDGDEDASGPLTGTITLDVTPVNDLPTSADSSVVTVENIAITFAASDFVFSDLETATIDSLRIDSLPGNGVLQNGAVLLNPGDVVLAADLDNLTYTPNTNFNGSDSFTFSVSDGTDYSVNPNTMTITVSAVNNVPSSMDSMTSTNEDQAWTFTAADFPFADVESASIVALRIDALPTNGVLMNGATAINAGDVIVAANLSNLSFTPAADFNGTDSFAFSVFDGIDYSAAPNTMTITVNAINDIPNSGDFSISTMEDASLTFAVSDFPFADAENAGIVALRIDTIPANGVLMNGTTVVDAGDVIVAADLANLSYTPTAGFNGADSFSFSVSDGTAYSSAPSTLTANVNPATVVTPVYVPPIDPPVVVRPDLPVQVSMSVVDPVVTETAVQEVDTVTEGVTEDETTPEEKPAQAAVSEAVPVFPGDPGVQGPDTPPDYDSNQRVGVDSSVKVNLQSLLQAIRIQLPGWDNLQLEAGELFDPMNLLAKDDFNRDMDQLREDATEDMVSRQMTAGTGVVLTTSLTIGYVAYLVRGGVLLSSVLSALPVWSFIDPTPILASMKNGDDDDSDADDSLESLVTQDQPPPEVENEDLNKEDKG